MVELLVVIAVLGLLISLVTVVASRAIQQQRARNSEQIMQNTALALEQFATENPLRAVYDRKGVETFGKYPPYALANWNIAGSVATRLEGFPPAPGRGSSADNLLSDRLARDLGCQNSGDKEDWVIIGSEGSADYPDGNDDIRALSAYLKLFSPGALGVIPEDRLKPLDPLDPRSRDFANPRGTGGRPGDPGTDWVDLFAIHDAWDVPLDYMLYAKLEWRVPPGGTSAQWVVTERRPVVRSRGIEREVYDAWVQSNQDEPTERERRLSPPDKWIFSEDLPKPWLGGSNPANVGPDGSINVSATEFSGWVRVVGLSEQYAYRPDGDTPEP